MGSLGPGLGTGTEMQTQELTDPHSNIWLLELAHPEMMSRFGSGGIGASVTTLIVKTEERDIVVRGKVWQQAGLNLGTWTVAIGDMDSGYCQRP